MPFTADQIINKKIFAKSQIEKYNLSGRKIGVIPAGLIGTVFSYVTRRDGVYWIIGNGPGSFLVKHNPASISLDPTERREIEQKEKQKKEKEEKEAKGPVSFYIEKYGRWVLFYGLAYVAIREIVKNR